MSVSAIFHRPNPLQTPDWTALRESVPEVAAKRLAGILGSLDGIEKQAFAMRGMAMLLIEERELWRWVVDESAGDYYQSRDKWLKDTLPNSWSYCYDALRAVKELKDIRFEDLLEIKRCNLEQLKKTSTSVRTLPDVVTAAKTLPEKAFVEKMNVEHHQALECKAPVVMAPAGDVEEFEKAVEMVTVVEDCHSRGEALRAMAICIIREYQDEYERVRKGAETA